MSLTSLAIPFLIICAFAQVWAAVNDARTMIIPNWISLVILASFFCAIPFVWIGMVDFLAHLKSGFGVFIVVFAMFAFGLFGGGDAKILASTAFWFTPVELITYIAYFSIAGGLLALIVLIGRKYLPASITASQTVFKTFHSGNQIPYGIALAAGALLALPQSSIYARMFGF